MNTTKATIETLITDRVAARISLRQVAEARQLARRAMAKEHPTAFNYHALDLRCEPSSCQIQTIYPLAEVEESLSDQGHDHLFLYAEVPSED